MILYTVVFHTAVFQAVVFHIVVLHTAVYHTVVFHTVFAGKLLPRSHVTGTGRRNRGRIFQFLCVT